MQEKLKILLDKIKLDEDKYNVFEDASLEKIVGNKARDTYQFFIHVPSNLDAVIFKELKEKLISSFKEVEKVSVKITVDEENTDKLNDYYHEFLKDKIEEFPLLSMSLDDTVSKEENGLVITIGNKAEQIKLTGIERELISFLKQAGYGIDKIEYQVDEEKSKQVKI